LIVYGQKNPGRLTYATSGVGNAQHLNGELLQSLIGVQMTHLPYKGASNQLVDVASGNVDLTFVSMAAAASFMKAGRVKVLGVTSAKRASFAPEIPAIAETKAAATYNLENWFGIFAPAATPLAVQAKLNTLFVQLLRDPAVIRQLQEQGGEVNPMTPQQFTDFIKQETVKYERIVDAANITAE
jgi:tripartite-type tricarboxylate transporter receptor subunit TctC